MNDREKLAKLVNESFHKCLSVVCRDCPEYDKDMKAGDRSCQGRLFADHLLANGVTVQKHGRWEHLDDDLVDLWKCTACGEEWAFGYDPTSAETTVPFCPECGARMDGE